MPTQLTGDYSRYPQALQERLPYVFGEVCELRQLWATYHRLFMEDERLTTVMSEQLGPLLGNFQSMAQDEMFLSISRLTDEDQRKRTNLSMWGLKEAVANSSNPIFLENIEHALDAIVTTAVSVRSHRNKRIAHFDLAVSLKSVTLPVVTFTEIQILIEKLEEYLNLFAWEFEQSTTFFNMLPGVDITGRAEMTAFKARVYDRLAKEGKISAMEWRPQWKNERLR